MIPLLVGRKHLTGEITGKPAAGISDWNIYVRPHNYLINDCCAYFHAEGLSLNFGFRF